jgi:hypothetical protein
MSQATRLLPSEDLSVVARHDYDKLKKWDFKTLTGLFLSTTQKLRSKRIVIFCLIDSISMYENRDSRKDSEKLVKFFRTLARPTRPRSRAETKNKLTFKLLITDEQSSELAVKYFKGTEILEMDEELDTDIDSEASVLDSD